MSAQDKTGAPSGAPTLEQALTMLCTAIGAEMCAELEARQADHKRLVRELDVALNGEAGAAPQASLCDIVAQVRRQQPVQILNLTDGMRINFQAPDGRRGTLHLGRLLDALGGDSWIFEPGIADVARAAIQAYPVAGIASPAPHSDNHDAAQVQALAIDPDHYA